MVMITIPSMVILIHNMVIPSYPYMVITRNPNTFMVIIIIHNMVKRTTNLVEVRDSKY